MPDLTTPEFLQNKSTDEIHQQMIDALPADLDVSQGGHAWNLTRPTALIAAEICEFILPEVIKLIFPDYAYGEYLDYHAKTRNITRLAATAATGEITVTGRAGTIIPAGSLFSTESVNDEPSVDYQTTEEAEIPQEGTVTIPIECTQTGVIGNTQAGMITLVSSRISGLTGVINEEDVSGGTEAESDDSLRERISEYDKSLGMSFVGNPGDYKRWARSVDGVGDATIISAVDNTGEVTIILTDAAGNPATEDLCEDVYNYIMMPDDPVNRRAPIGAHLTVIPPDTMPISIKATIELVTGGSITAVQDAYRERIALYLSTAIEEGEVKYTQVAAILADIDGVNDFKDLQIGAKTEGGEVTYGTANLPITSYQLPTVDEDDLIFTEGTV